jgi:hypothetical protein
MRPALAAIALVCAFSSAAAAMHVEYSVALVAWASDGRTALVEHRGHGPEGGSQLSFEIVGVEPAERMTVGLSSALGSGGGSRAAREKIGAAQCAKHVAQLAEVVKRRQVRAVVNASGCAKRTGFISVPTGRPPTVPGAATAQMADEQLTISKGAKTLVFPAAGAIEAWVSPDGRLILLAGVERLGAIYFSPTGELADYKRVP